MNTTQIKECALRILNEWTSEAYLSCACESFSTYRIMTRNLPCFDVVKLSRELNLRHPWLFL
jgi:hypothetical protein